MSAPKKLSVRFEGVSAERAGQLTQSLTRFLNDAIVSANQESGDPQVQLEPGYRPNAQGEPIYLTILIAVSAGVIHGMAAGAAEPFTKEPTRRVVNRVLRKLTDWWERNGRPVVALQSETGKQHALVQGDDGEPPVLAKLADEIVQS